MPEAIQITRGVVVPAGAQRFRAVRSSGPGGQNVNKVASKVELRINLAGIQGLSAAARGRLESSVARRLDAEGLWLVTSQRTRDQGRNLEDARQKIRILVARALVAPRKRRPTRPSAAAREKRLVNKHRTSQVKQTRRRVRGVLED